MNAIFFDSNAGDAESGFILWFPQSIRGLHELPGGPQEGMEIELLMPNELHCLSRLKYDSELGYWRAVVITGTMRLIASGGSTSQP